MSAMKRLFAATLAVIGLVIAAASLGSTASAYPAGTAPSISVSSSTVAPGGSDTVSGTNFTPNSSVSLSLHSDPVDLGTVTTDGSGNFSAAVTIPSSTATGSHTIEALDTPTGDVATAAITVSTSGTGTGGGGGGGGLAGTGVAVIGIGALGIVLLVGGGLMLMAGRRRKVIA